mgnify:CR=1 FL=1
MKDNELMHYGVLGMKWGVRRGNVSGAYKKASKKLDSMNRKIVKKQKKADKFNYKADKKMYSPFSSESDVRIARQRASEAQNKVDRKVYKAKRWIDKMDKVFSNTTQSLSKEQIALGKSYADQLKRNSEMNMLIYKLNQ